MADLQRDPILITGTPRSGTSVVARIFVECGAWCGDCIGADGDNPTGYWENMDMMRHVRAMLGRMGIDQEGNGQPLWFFADQAVRQWGGWDAAEDLRNAIHAIVMHQGLLLQRGQPWFFKSPTIALVWPLWRAAFPRAVWVHVTRDLDAVNDSIGRYRAITKVIDKRHYADQRSQLEVSMPDPDLEIYHHSGTIAAAYRPGSHQVDQLRRTIAAAGLVWSDAALDHIDPDRQQHTAGGTTT